MQNHRLNRPLANITPTTNCFSISIGSFKYLLFWDVTFNFICTNNQKIWQFPKSIPNPYQLCWRRNEFESTTKLSGSNKIFFIDQCRLINYNVLVQDYERILFNNRADGRTSFFIQIYIYRFLIETYLAA